MTRDEMLKYVRNLSGEESDDIVLAFLSRAGDAILHKMYPFIEDLSEYEVPGKYQSLQCDIASYLLDRRGTLGEIRNTEGVITREYGSSYIPDSMLKEVTPKGKVFEV